MSEKKILDLKAYKKKIVKILIIIFIVAMIAGALYIRFVAYNNEAKITSKQVNYMLEQDSELTTAKLNYTGIVEYDDEGLPVINKSNFVMTYDAVVRTGIDVKEIEPEVDNRKQIIWLTIPKAEIQEITIDPASIRFYDEGFALFNVDEREDAVKAQELAQENAKEKISEMGVLELADKQSQALIKGILEDHIPQNYTIKFKGK